MSWNKPFEVNEPAADWGGPWTETKLDAFSKYVSAYLIIMKKKPWQTIYFDGFAGSGSRGKPENDELWRQLKITEEEKVYSGAAERVLAISGLSFDHYYFIDTNQTSLQALEEKLQEKSIGKKIIYRPSNVNDQLPLLANALKNNKYAALVFLDPFGMQIDWTAIAELKGTRSDIWILVPSGVIVNRLLDKAGELKHWDILQKFFGLPIEEIESYFYKKAKEETLFGEEEIITKVSKPIEKIAQLYATRLKTIWKFATEEPLVLKNKNGAPIFHFVFASNNKTAINIAKQIIQKV